MQAAGTRFYPPLLGHPSYNGWSTLVLPTIGPSRGSVGERPAVYWLGSCCAPRACMWYASLHCRKGETPVLLSHPPVPIASSSSGLFCFVLFAAIGQFFFFLPSFPPPPPVWEGSCRKVVDVMYSPNGSARVTVSYRQSGGLYCNARWRARNLIPKFKPDLLLNMWYNTGRKYRD